MVQGASGRGLWPAFRDLLSLPTSAPGFDIVLGGFVFFYRLGFVFGVGLGCLAAAVVSCLCLVGRVRHTSTTLLNNYVLEACEKCRKKCEIRVVCLPRLEGVPHLRGGESGRPLVNPDVGGSGPLPSVIRAPLGGHRNECIFSICMMPFWF